MIFKKHDKFVNKTGEFYNKAINLLNKTHDFIQR